MRFIKRKKIVFAAIVLVLSLGIISGIATQNLPTTGGVASKQFVIIIDAGHGGIDGGAVGVNGTVEKRINLEIALQLRDVFEAAGYTVIMTRDTDRSIHDSTAQSVREMKVSDLHNRLELTELYPNSLLISIHQNTLGDSSVTGAQVFYSPNDPNSQVLAQQIQDQFNAYIQPNSEREIKSAGKNLFLFYNAKNTAILAECGFLSNSAEEQLLCSAEHQKKLIHCIYSGVLEYLSENGEKYGIA